MSMGSIFAGVDDRIVEFVLISSDEDTFINFDGCLLLREVHLFLVKGEAIQAQDKVCWWSGNLAPFACLRLSLAHRAFNKIV
eukprot:Skav200502  [mRNA]  locus=scaffold450:329532:329777:+ [translate_table: standard]